MHCKSGTLEILEKSFKIYQEQCFFHIKHNITIERIHNNYTELVKVEFFH